VLTTSTPWDSSTISQSSWQEGNWLASIQSRFWLYPVHISGCYFTSPSLSASLYLVLLMLLRRQYAEASRLLATCFKDSPFTAEELWIVGMLAKTGPDQVHTDMHPDAIACRLKLALVCVECGHGPIEPASSENDDARDDGRDSDSENITRKAGQWAVQTDHSKMIQIYAHVSKACCLSYEDEQHLLDVLSDSGHTNLQRRKYLDAVQRAEDQTKSVRIELSSSSEAGGLMMVQQFYKTAAKMLDDNPNVVPGSRLWKGRVMFQSFNRPTFNSQSGREDRRHRHSDSDFKSECSRQLSNRLPQQASKKKRTRKQLQQLHKWEKRSLEKVVAEVKREASKQWWWRTADEAHAVFAECLQQRQQKECFAFGESATPSAKVEKAPLSDQHLSRQPIAREKPKPAVVGTLCGERALRLLGHLVDDSGSGLNDDGAGGLLWEMALGAWNVDIGGGNSLCMAKLTLGMKILLQTKRYSRMIGVSDSEVRDVFRLSEGQDDDMEMGLLVLLAAATHAALDESAISNFPTLPTRLHDIQYPGLVVGDSDSAHHNELGNWLVLATREAKRYCSGPRFQQHLSIPDTPVTKTKVDIGPELRAEMRCPRPTDTSADARVLSADFRCAAFAELPLKQLNPTANVYVRSGSASDVGDESLLSPLDKLPFETGKMHASGARLVNRMEVDLRESASKLKRSTRCWLECLAPTDLNQLENSLTGSMGGSAPDRQLLTQAIQRLQELHNDAASLKAAEDQGINDERIAVVAEAHYVGSIQNDSTELIARRRVFLLQRLAGQQFSIRFEWLASLLLSSNAVADLQQANEFISKHDAERVLAKVSAVLCE
jgi:hypothetical protein